MPTRRHPSAFVLIGLALLAASMLRPHELTTTAASFASAAADSLWVRRACILAILISALRLVSIRRHSAYLLGWAAFLLLALAPALAYLIGSLTLWAAPAHVMLALLSWAGAVGLLSSGPRPQPRGLAVRRYTALILLLLGLAWNHVQTGGEAGWAWDWIEAGPLLLLVGTMAAAHFWARSPWLAPIALYAALLQVSRNALTLSLHHAQPPQATYATGRVALATLGGGVGGCLLLLGSVVIWQSAPAPRYRAIRHAAGRPCSAFVFWTHGTLPTLGSFAITTAWLSEGVAGGGSYAGGLILYGGACTFHRRLARR